MSRRLPMLDPFEEIKRLYFSTTRETIERDMARALELLRQMPSDEARERAAGYMHGLTDLQREWRRAAKRRARARAPRAGAAPKDAGASGSRAKTPKKPDVG
ncbi:MAG TPA: hypothetical protein VF198_02095 [Vicinamibacterales bacterium]